MSAGRFEDGKYQASGGGIFACRAQPESKQLVLNGVSNAYPAGDVDQPYPIRLRVGKRTRGLVPRTVTVRFTGAVPAGYLEGGTHEVVVFQNTTFASYTETAGQTGTYLGSPVVMVGQYPKAS